MSNQRKRLNGGEREDEDEEDAEGIGEWERAYVDDRSWEALQEDESGLLRPIDNSAIYHAQYRRRLRMLSAAAAGTRIQKGLIRYLYIVIDFSRVKFLCKFGSRSMALVADFVNFSFNAVFFELNREKLSICCFIRTYLEEKLCNLGH